ncbi:diguanylate cyclase [Pseudoxanthomonas winnipegensis]|jgi:diguanylate cyclase (GGDEF)-like protein/PAS domain S-box-containing protein|uniref:Diguanylate cyclase n=1 Tax=Pseudoxanthomonas winnipegensis TaxID=2480810 RepID=A0ABY1WIU3_9GAMM|nr:diguanylate cyclase [Pseudoxanthomonas winnipegensis]TAA09961.1 diguanylate cyclase [Pseudoxanthomonas winnipegensis]TAA22660.1 diguanylate cyclase [Pseudoxanthomonas winnipegensis]TAH73072.1 diguanylate cyclase [Pseudoxanthomonas winnipegensis]
MAEHEQDYESERLRRLMDLRVMDSSPEPLFDALTRAAAELTASPVALITLIEQDRQWIKSNHGLPGLESTARTTAFCDYAIRSDKLLEVRDARRDVRFSRFETVVGEPYVRFYAGAPLTLTSGHRVGTLCVFDTVPRQLEPAQRAALEQLAHAAVAAIELRAQLLRSQEGLTRSTLELSTALQRSTMLERRLRDSEAFLERTGRAAGVGGFEVNLDTGRIQWSDQTCRIHDVPPGFAPSGLDEALSFYDEQVRDTFRDAVRRAIEQGEPWDLELPQTTRAGRRIWVRSVGRREVIDRQPKLVGAFQDVTLRHRAVQALETSERRFRKLFESSLGLICTHDAQGTILSANPASARSLDIELTDVLGHRLIERIRPQRHAQFHEYLERVFRDGSASGTLELIARDGSLRYWDYHNVVDTDEGEPYVLGYAQDVTVQVAQARVLRDHSFHDPLTHCFNRRYLHELESRWQDRSVGCVAVDLDHFKQVNDAHGHRRGDAVLVAFAEFLQRHAGAEGVVVRLGGDEFAVILPDQDPASLDAWMAQLRAAGDQVPIGFSKGAAIRAAGATLEQTLELADQALYRQRRRHRGRSAGVVAEAR